MPLMLLTAKGRKEHYVRLANGAHSYTFVQSNRMLGGEPSKLRDSSRSL